MKIAVISETAALETRVAATQELHDAVSKSFLPLRRRDAEEEQQKAHLSGTQRLCGKSTQHELNPLLLLRSRPLVPR